MQQAILYVINQVLLNWPAELKNLDEFKGWTHIKHMIKTLALRYFIFADAAGRKEVEAATHIIKFNGNIQFDVTGLVFWKFVANHGFNKLSDIFFAFWFEKAKYVTFFFVRHQDCYVVLILLYGFTFES